MQRKARQNFGAVLSTELVAQNSLFYYTSFLKLDILDVGSKVFTVPTVLLYSTK